MSWHFDKSEINYELMSPSKRPEINRDDFVYNCLVNFRNNFEVNFRDNFEYSLMNMRQILNFFNSAKT